MDHIKNFFKYSKKDSLIRDSFILFISTLGVSLAGFFYHFYMGRVLGPEQYSILGALFSLIYIILVPFQVIQTSITNFVARFKAKKQDNKINTLFIRSLKKLTLYSLVLMIIFAIASKFIAEFLHIQIKYILLILPLILLSFLLPVSRGLMQGSQLFKGLGINMTIEGLSKVIFGILLVIIGFGIFGAIFAIILSFLLPLIGSLFVLRSYLKKKKSKIISKDIYSYAIPVTLALLIFTGFYSIDIFIIKHFFNEAEAGLYVALSYIGRIIFFATQSIALVMFPKSVENFTIKKINFKILDKALILVSIVGSLGVLFYLLFPKFVINILYGKEYLNISNLVWLFGLAMLFFSLVYVLILYNLSINKRKFIYIILFFLIIEGILLWFLHANLLQVTIIMALIMFLMFIVIYIYTKNAAKYNNSSV